jgi:RNA polymerase sigma-70 factor, ECF subfamily
VGTVAPAALRRERLTRLRLGFSAREVAESLETTDASVNSALQRARRTVDERLPARSQQTTLRSLGDEGIRELVRDYVAAWESRDVEAMVAMLVEDATFAMPPFPNWWWGRDAVIGFLRSTGEPELRQQVVRSNGQVAIGWYLWDPEREVYAPASLEVLAIEGRRVKEITAFVFLDLFTRFGLPAELPRAD